MSSSKIIFGKKIKRLIKDNNMTQKQLADAVFVSPSTVSTWTRGLHVPDHSLLNTLCEIFNVSFNELLDDSIDISSKKTGIAEKENLSQNKPSKKSESPLQDTEKDFVLLGKYLPDSLYYIPDGQQDSLHMVYDADLANEGRLHRFTNAVGDEISAIYRAGSEVWWHYREHEAQMIRDWNEWGYKI